jgi:hypothetical protein
MPDPRAPLGTYAPLLRRLSLLACLGALGLAAGFLALLVSRPLGVSLCILGGLPALAGGIGRVVVSPAITRLDEAKRPQGDPSV